MRHGTVRCQDFPFVVITSNGERSFRLAFLRRCIRLELPEPARISSRASFGRTPPRTCISCRHSGARVQDLIRTFAERRSLGGLATDQLLHAVHLLQQGIRPEVEHLREAVLRELNNGGVR